MNKNTYYIILCCILLIAGCATHDTTQNRDSKNIDVIYPPTLSFYKYPPVISNKIINVIVEIPAGTHEKWEVTPDGASMRLEYIKGVPRIIQYLPYPCNYGMIPGTLLSKEKGGDGDPLDVLLLGERVARGKIIPARLIGFLPLIDRGEKDDKIIAVQLEGPLSDITSLYELEEKYPGVITILRTWFTSYKGPGKCTAGYAEEAESAMQLVEKARNENVQKKTNNKHTYTN